MKKKSKPKGFFIKRRSLLKGAGLGAGIALASGILKPAILSAGPLDRIKAGKGGESKKLDPGAGLSIILLGTGTPLPNKDRACASTLVLAGDKAFLVDTGRGFLTRFADTGLRDVDAVFITHYHSDHFGELGEFLVTRTIWGASKPLTVFGPPGLKDVTGGVIAAYALDNKYRKAHHQDKWSEDAMKVVATESGPGVVYEKDGVKVTMFEVDHAPVKPAMAYRFDYKGQVVVISGDTKKNQAMVDMAKNADILVHEVVNKQMTEIGQRMVDARMQEMATEMLQYHTTTEEVAEIARDANVKKLVLTHFAPSLPENAAMEAMFIRGMSGIYKGEIIVGRDGLQVKA